MDSKAEKIAAIIAITQVFKYYGVPSKFCPIVAMGFGAAFGYADNPTAQGIIDGVVLGAMTTGSYGVLKGSARAVLKPLQKTPVDILEPDDDRGV
ncbi:hypothetical protein KKA33_01815 [Patescibacteria group bacterium]|nr:hypothetical protein [Patescibacteria group bacterium]